MNLVSVGKLADEGCHIVFGKGMMENCKGFVRMLAEGKKRGTLYTLKSKLMKEDIVATATKEDPRQNLSAQNTWAPD
jgi:hypothetical protein